MKTLTAVAVAALLSGCASIPQPNQPAIHHKAPVAKVKPAPIEQATPNQAVKKRWFRGFKVRLFH
jgi:hypothetical protein